MPIIQLTELMFGLHGSHGSDPRSTSSPSDIPSPSVSNKEGAVNKKLYS